MHTAEADFDDDDPEPRLAWLRAHAEELAEVPLPGKGSTSDRFRTLAELGHLDGSLGRLAEGHLDAIAILSELAVPAGDPHTLRGVWAARPDELAAVPDSDGWSLRGRKPWCSGAEGLDRALLTAVDPEGHSRLFDVDVSLLAFEDDWVPIGMKASDSCTALVDVTLGPDAEVGGPDRYVVRAGFGHGGVGVAAVWHGLSQRVADDLATYADERDDPYARAGAGTAAALAAAASALLGSAARSIDEVPDDVDAARTRAGIVRIAVEQLARSVLHASTSIQGASALCFDAHHGRVINDLTVYLGQIHHGRDAAGVEPSLDDWWS